MDDIELPLLSKAGLTTPGGESEMGRLIRAYDWSTTPLGTIAKWPASVSTTVALLLRSPLPIVTLWGEQGIMIYNDAYSAFAGGRHPRLLGSPVREGWPEVADFNDNVMKVGLAGGTLSYKDQELTLYRSGKPEQVWMNLDYSPVIGEGGIPVGVIAFVVETSDRVRAARRLEENERRLRFLDHLTRESAKPADADTILAVTTRMVGEHLGVASCAYADMDADQDGFTIRGDWAEPGMQHILGHYSLAAFGELAMNNLKAGMPLVVNDVVGELPAAAAQTFLAIGLGATICMPLVKEGRLTALMAIHHRKPHAWTGYERALIAEVAERSWAHIERARWEAEVRASEERYRLAVAAGEMGTWRHDLLSGALELDERSREHYGFTMPLVTLDGIMAAVHPEDLPGTRAAVASSLDPANQGSPVAVEYRVIRPGGDVHWLSVFGQVHFDLRDGELRPISSVGTTQDITPRKRIEERLRDSEGRYRELANSMPDVVWQTDPAGIIHYVNERWCGYTGRPLEDAIGKSLFSVMEAEDSRRAVDSWMLAVAARSMYEAEWRLRRTDGEEFWMLSRGHPIVDSSGTIVRWVGTDTDISHSRDREDALRESEERLRLALEAAKAGSWDYDLKSSVFRLSDRLFAIHGMAPTPGNTILAEDWDRWVFPADVEAVRKEAERARQAHDYFSSEHRILRKDDGELRWVRGFGQYLFDTHGDATRFVGFYEDITERKRAEERIHFLMREVNHRSKNLLAVVQAIAKQTAAEGDPAAFAARFGERLQGLAASQDLLVKNQWQGVELSELVRSQLSHFSDLLEDRIALDGPRMEVSAAAAQNLGLALHELATNAGKYGSLTNQNGTLRISWRIEGEGGDGHFVMEWIESGGPPVQAPSRRGLGSLLTTRITERAFEGAVELDYAESGVTWSMSAPLRNVVRTIGN